MTSIIRFPGVFLVHFNSSYVGTAKKKRFFSWRTVSSLLVDAHVSTIASNTAFGFATRTPAARASSRAHIVDVKPAPVIERLGVLECTVGDLARLDTPLARHLGHIQYLWRKKERSRAHQSPDSVRLFGQKARRRKMTNSTTLHPYPTFAGRAETRFNELHGE